MPADYSIIRVDSVEPTPSRKSGTPTVSLTDELSCERLHARVWYLSPGDAMSHHRHHEQEELYYVLDGPARFRIDDKVHDVDTGTAIRVHPDTPRQVLNDTEGDHVWLIIGAPPADDDGRPAED
jgi:quercetin dioxygenase-like cupin family protein